MSTHKIQFTVDVEPELFRLLSRYQLQYRHASRSLAVAELLRRGLASVEADALEEIAEQARRFEAQNKKETE